MAFGSRYSVLLIGAAASASVEHYCHFYENQQSVCLSMDKGKGHIGAVGDKRLSGVSKHEVFFWSDDPEHPVYNSSNWSIEGSNGVRKGVWSFPKDMSLPWPTNYDKITYKKVTGKPDYYDVAFAPNSQPRQFSKVEPISLSDIENNDGVGIKGRPLTFLTGHHYSIKANVMPQEVSRRRGSKPDFSINASLGIPVIFIEQIESSS
ncbi:hypothetical protein FOL47_010485 [Perkinsus chesapeaki]|uniref:Uncharacterized protein n=1 Tax=Perkinsus chesapeaki TaxID=330153 RepID=A0A7J6L3W1_PERCH|nr:hypothetical protein FOL47_010485 [Perkinsus chesapeaki]